MKKITAILVFTALVLAVGSGHAGAQSIIDEKRPVVQDVIKWVQPPDLDNGWNVPTWGTYIPRGMPIPMIVVADDWKCPDGLPITDIHWWGGYEVGQVGGLVAFELSIHEDVPENECCPSHPGDLLWSALVSVGEGEHEVREEFFGFNYGGDVLHYSYYFPEGDNFAQEKDKIYWLNVVGLRAPDDNETIWGWHTAIRPGVDNGLDAAVGIYDYDFVRGEYERWGALYDQGCRVQMAFAFSTIPEPTSLALLGTAGMLLVGMHRRRKRR